jgi:hypothetical protein
MCLLLSHDPYRLFNETAAGVARDALDEVHAGYNLRGYGAVSPRSLGA